MSVNEVMVKWADEHVAKFGCEVILSTGKIKNEITKVKRMNIKEGSIIPSDHCYNRVNNDPTSHGSKTPLFLYVSYNKYKCVGSEYEYSGPIFCRPKESNKDILRGYYDSKTQKKVPCSSTTDHTVIPSIKNIPKIKPQSNFHIHKGPNLKTAVEIPYKMRETARPTKLLDRDFFDSIIKYLQNKENLYVSPIVKSVDERKSGRIFSLSDHLRGYIYAQLSNNRPWEPLEVHLPEIDKIFCDYDLPEIIDKINSVGYEYFVRRITGIRCGNRGINAQMQALEGNIRVFTKLIDKYGSLDKFVTSRLVLEIIEMLSDYKSPYKLRTMGIPLTAEYLRNVGVDCPKPDVHMCRIFGNRRLGISSQEVSSASEVFQIISILSKKVGYSQAMIDNIIWSYCAEGYGAICSSNPKCNVCVVQDYCRQGN